MMRCPLCACSQLDLPQVGRTTWGQTALEGTLYEHRCLNC